MDNNDLNHRKQFGKNIKIARNKMNLTQEQLAEKLSLSTRYISQLERGISFGTLDTIISICRTLNISANYLFDGLISSNSDDFANVVDINFAKNFVKLNKSNKELLYFILLDMLKIQYRDSGNNSYKNTIA